MPNFEKRNYERFSKEISYQGTRAMGAAAGGRKAIPSHPVAVTWEQRPTPTTPQCPAKELQQGAGSSPLSLLFSRLSHPSSLSRSP